jgi:hypothetical protein
MRLRHVDRRFVIFRMGGFRSHPGVPPCWLPTTLIAQYLCRNERRRSPTLYRRRVAVDRDESGRPL